MLSKRIIACLDVKDGEVVKGVNFVNLTHVGSAIELSKRYEVEGIDELVFLDITATNEKRKTLVQLVADIAKELRIPFTVGGGISEIKDIEMLLLAGADKVSLNSSIVRNPKLITEASKQFGSQAVVAAIDVKQVAGEKKVFINAGKRDTGMNGLIWAKEVQELGAGEILLTSMDHDGTKNGYDVEFLRQVSENVSIPVIASGGAGKKEDFLEAFTDGKVDACLAASLFHYKQLEVKELKEYLHTNGVEVRR